MTSNGIKISENTGKKKYLTRRDVVRLGAVSALGIIGLQLFPFMFYDEVAQAGHFPTYNGKINREGRNLMPISRAIKILDALVLLYKGGFADSNLLSYYLAIYGISEADLFSLFFLTDDGLDLLDIATIYESIEDVANLEKVNLLQVIKRLSENPNKEAWSKYIITNKLGPKILDLGLKGKRVLNNLGLLNNSFDFQASLLKDQSHIETISSQKAINYYRDDLEVHNSMVAISYQGGWCFYQYTQSMDSKKLRPSQYILTRLTNFYFQDEILSVIEHGVFVVFEELLYEELLKWLPSDGSLAESAFTKSFASQIYKKEVDDGSFCSAMKKIYLELKELLGNKLAMEKIELMLNGSIGTFREVFLVLPPRALSFFNSKIIHKMAPSTFQVILNESLDGTYFATRKLSELLVKYSGNLYLESLVDHLTVEGEKRAIAYKVASFEAGEVIRSIVNEEISLDVYASHFYGSRKILVLSDSGKYYGQVVSGRVTEPVYSVPQRVIEILDSVEGKRWQNGAKYLETIIGRNIVAKASGNPVSGGSDRIMQLMEMLFPSPFDLITSLSDYDGMEFPFRRPDLYGSWYLNFVLYPAVRDGLGVSELYIPHTKLKELPESNAINRLCAKLESFILAMDFTSKFGKEILDELYVQFVPIGNASGAAAGMQMQGLEAGANYYFGKNLDLLNDGEICILIGLIQSPLNYSPIKWNGEKWVDNRKDCFDRATMVASLCTHLSGFDLETVRKQIYGAHFEYLPNAGWMTTMSDQQISNLKPGTFDSLGVSFELGVKVVREPSDKDYVPKFPKIVDLPEKLSPVQILAENWFSKLTSGDRLKLNSRESGRTAEVLAEAATLIDQGYKHNDEMVVAVAKLAKELDPEFDYNYWEGKFMGQDISPAGDIPNKYKLNSPKSDLWCSLYELHCTPVWQCGQCAILLNCLLRLGTNLDMPYALVAGNVKTWLGVLDWDKKGKPKKDYLKMHNCEVFALDKMIKGNRFVDDQVIDMFCVGDMIITWRSFDYGHVVTVIDKGKDSLGRSYITILDANYNSNGRVRRQTFWSEKILSLLYPGKAIHAGVVRPSGLVHGREVKVQEGTFLDKMILVSIDNKTAVLPGFDQVYETASGGSAKLTNPGLAIASYDAQGLKFSIDPTNLLESSFVSPGNLLKPFVYVFALLKGVNPKNLI